MNLLCRRVLFVLGTFFLMGGSHPALMGRAAAEEKPAGAPSLEVLIKQLEEAAKSGNPANVANLFAEPFASDLRTIQKLQDDLSATLAELEERGRAKIGERPPLEKPNVGKRVVIRPMP